MTVAVVLALVIKPRDVHAQTITATALTGNSVVVVGTNLQDAMQLTIGDVIATELAADPNGTMGAWRLIRSKGPELG